MIKTQRQGIVEIEAIKRNKRFCTFLLLPFFSSFLYFVSVASAFVLTIYN